MEHTVSTADIDQLIDETLKCRDVIRLVIPEINKIENKILLQNLVISDSDLKDYQYLHGYLLDFCNEMYEYPAIDFFRSTVDELSDKLRMYKYILDRCNKKQPVAKSAHLWLYFKVRWLIFRWRFGPFPMSTTSPGLLIRN